MQIIADPKLYEEKERLYYDVRNKEGRIISDETLKQLPYADSSNPYYSEWNLRAKNMERFLAYLKKRKQPSIKILDVGCGNGWMTHLLSEAGCDVTGADLNMEELQQAERVFGTDEKLKWLYANVLTDNIPGAPFDLIIFGASCQYFPNINELTKKLLPLLSPGGEIHLLDSIFYKDAQIGDAASRSKEYYSSLGFPEMAGYYHHHSIPSLKKAGYTKVHPGLFSKATPLQWWKTIKQ
ncbi:MAG: class I SAM-dependent methyltransferase [Bacteroidetes bacterium]|nr:class I SAM-dependent methyltransferase [Bacteroidota bacterium]